MEYLQFLLIILLSPLINGTINKLKAWMQGRRGPGIFQPYYELLRLFKKDMKISNTASWIFHAAPYIVFASTAAAAVIVPVITTETPFGMMGDIIALVYIFALGRFFLALAGLDTGTAFGGEGSSREMTVAILVEPMLIMSIFTAAVTAGSTNIAQIAGFTGAIYTPSHILAFLAFGIVVIAETGRVPVDNPDTHLELTMIYEGMLLEYSGRYLALMEWAHYIKQMVLFTLIIDIFFPAGIATGTEPATLAVSCGIYILKLLIIAFAMALIESTRAKMRFFQLPSLLGGGFVLAVLSLLTYIMLGK